MRSSEGKASPTTHLTTRTKRGGKASPTTHRTTHHALPKQHTSQRTHYATGRSINRELNAVLRVRDPREHRHTKFHDSLYHIEFFNQTCHIIREHGTKYLRKQLISDYTGGKEDSNREDEEAGSPQTHPNRSSLRYNHKIQQVHGDYQNLHSPGRIRVEAAPPEWGRGKSKRDGERK